MREINIAWMYPDVLNMHGDRGNLMGLNHLAKHMNIKLNITKINKIDEIEDFNMVDLIYMGACQIKDVNFIVKDMTGKVNQLKEYISNGKNLLAIGSTGCIIGSQLITTKGEVIKGLGLVDIKSKELNRTKMPYVTREVYGDDINFLTKSGMEIIGCQIQRVDYFLGKELEAFGKLLYGYGNNHVDGQEGAVYKNLILTNTVGPLITSNPWFGVELLKEILLQKGETIEESSEEVSNEEVNNDEVSNEAGNKEVNKEAIEIMDYAKEALKLKKDFIKAKWKLKGITYKTI